MWRLVREGLKFYRPVLLISWAAGVGILTLVVTIVSVVGSVKDRSQIASEIARLALQAPLAILIASMIAGFIVTGTERSEARVRMYVMLPLPIGQVAVARVLLPAALMLLGLALSHVVFAVMLAIEGSSALSPRHLNVDFMGLQLLLWVQMALVIREVTELRRAGRRRAAFASIALMVAAVAVVAWLLLGPIENVAIGVATVATLDVGLMAFCAGLFVRRTQFTK